MQKANLLQNHPDVLQVTVQDVACQQPAAAKQQKQLQQLINSREIGDSVETTSGFYGVIIDITDDMVIVEFGGNKNCRIPMVKTAITRVEKAEENNA